MHVKPIEWDRCSLPARATASLNGARKCGNREKTKNSQKFNSISVEWLCLFRIYNEKWECARNALGKKQTQNTYWKIWMRKLIETHPAICSWSIFIALLFHCLVYAMVVWVGCQPKPCTPKSNFCVMRRQCPRDVGRTCVRGNTSSFQPQMSMLWEYWRVQKRKKNPFHFGATTMKKDDEKHFMHAPLSSPDTLSHIVYYLFYLCAQWKQMNVSSECDAAMLANMCPTSFAAIGGARHVLRCRIFLCAHKRARPKKKKWPKRNLHH